MTVAVAPGLSVEHFAEWALGLYLDTGEPWELEPFQLEFVDDVFSGIPEAWLVVPEGNGKTTLLAGLALYHCEFTRAASVLVAASSREQAQIMFLQAQGFVMRSPSLRGSFRCQEGIRRIRFDDRGSRIQVVASDDRTGDGVIPTLCLVDELHRHRDLRLYRTWRGKLAKRDGQIVTISTAGEPGSEFEAVRQRMISEAEVVERDGAFTRAASPFAVLHEWAVPKGGNVEDLEVVASANPLHAVTLERLRVKRNSPSWSLMHWRRFVCNLPTRGESTAITEAEWAAARSDREIPAGEPVVAGLDIGWKHDTTALVPLWWQSEEFRLFGPATVLEPPRNGDMLPAGEVKAAVVELHERNPIEVLVMDMSNAPDIAQWASDELGLDVVDRPQSNPFQVADYEAFMAGLRSRVLWHSGDPGLTGHALNAVAKLLPKGDVRFDRPASSRTVRSELHRMRVIDALVAAAMAHSEGEARCSAQAWEPMVAVR